MKEIKKIKQLGIETLPQFIGILALYCVERCTLKNETI